MTRIKVEVTKTEDVYLDDDQMNTILFKYLANKFDVEKCWIEDGNLTYWSGDYHSDWKEVKRKATKQDKLYFKLSKALEYNKII
ncbi:MAG: hypothetical protein GY707_05645 [Desulfobacteraceae bacterium]|nr:hypothetical protein [Desulfobacteraceae bacterium]